MSEKDEIEIEEVLTISGATCSGKSLLEGNLVQWFGGGRVQTITTRERRVTEPKEAYDFTDIKGLKRYGDLLWVTPPVHGHVYAVRWSAFDKAAKETGGLAFIVITPDYHASLADAMATQGARCVHVHLAHPGDEEIARRLRKRGDDEEDIAKRLADSARFEEYVAKTKITGLHHLSPGTPREIFLQVLGLLEFKR